MSAPGDTFVPGGCPSPGVREPGFDFSSGGREILGQGGGDGLALRLPTPALAVASPISLDSPHVPTFACASGHSGTPARMAETPGG